jgi:hypothetical protein
MTFDDLYFILLRLGTLSDLAMSNNQEQTDQRVPRVDIQVIHEERTSKPRRPPSHNARPWIPDHDTRPNQPKPLLRRTSSTDHFTGLTRKCERRYPSGAACLTHILPFLCKRTRTSWHASPRLLREPSPCSSRPFRFPADFINLASSLSTHLRCELNLPKPCKGRR